MRLTYLLLILGLSTISAQAADEKSLDPMVVGKGMYTLKADDTDVRVMEVSIKPGQKIELHQHPKHVAYAVTAGTLKIHAEGKEPSETALKTGDAMIIPAEKHWAQNVGKTTVKLVVVELKGK